MRRPVASAILAVTLVFHSGLAHDHPTGWDDIPELAVTVHEDGRIDAPGTLAAGWYRLIVDDRTAEGAEVLFVRPDEGVTVGQVFAAVEAIMVAFMGEGHPGHAFAAFSALVELPGGQSVPNEVAIQLAAGEYLLLTSLVDDSGADVFAAVTVTGDAVAAPPEADVVVEMVDFAFHLPAGIAAGPQTWEVRNSGEQAHHLLLMRMADGSTLDDALAYFQGAQEGPPTGPPPVEEILTTEILSTAASNYFRFDLPAGEYLAICFLPDYDSGAPHIALGMLHTFSVAGD